MVLAEPVVAKMIELVDTYPARECCTSHDITMLRFHASLLSQQSPQSKVGTVKRNIKFVGLSSNFLYFTAR